MGKLTADFFWRMEDILDLYAAPYDPQRPVVCFDERPLQLLEEVYEPWPAAPGKPRREDYEYQRHGTCHLSLCFDPGRRWREVRVREQRTAQEFAWQMKWLVDEVYPEAEVIRVVLDNLNTHTPAAFYKTFSPEEARRLTQKLEFHDTPKHASWLNMVEIEFSILERQCLGRRLPDMAAVEREVQAWAEARNAARATVDWRFTTSQAREKFHRHYSKVDE